MKAILKSSRNPFFIRWEQTLNKIAFFTICLWLCPITFVQAQENAVCLACHGIKDFSTVRDKKTVSLYLEERKLAESVHSGFTCVTCHAGLEGKDLPHPERLERVHCDICHTDQQKLFETSLHGKALSRGDSLAPRCQSCHGSHDILPVKHPNSSVSPIRIPYVCGSCHSEGASVQRQRAIHQSRIIENYSESIHGEGLLKKGLSVSANCASCHTAHQILPHTDPRSTIARQNIVKTCTTCHAQIAEVHRKVIQGELWEKKPHTVPVCVECHQPHKARKVFYDQGMADKDCLRCHAQEDIRSSVDGRPLFVKIGEIGRSMHKKTACAQCHTGATPSKQRSCKTIIKKVDCAVCHSAEVEQYRTSTHGKLLNQNDPNAPTCVECHGTHGVLGRRESRSPTFPTNVPQLCARCHREGEKAAEKYQGKEHEITKNYTESIHGKGLLKSGLLVTAMCTSCHSAHRELPASDPSSSVHQDNVATTCSQCHDGIYEKFSQSVHSSLNNKTDKKLPICTTCHSAHKIKRTDADAFRLGIMSSCGECHQEIARTYFDTYHGKVAQLGYAKTAKCYDCHGAHDIFPIADPRSHLSRQNVVATCQKCHTEATRRFAGYLTHATHHDPKKYPWLFVTFWGMTILLLGTFAVSGLHALLWLPRALQMRREHPPKPSDPNEKQYVRFIRLNRVLHIAMIVCFISLALTGMILKFSYTGWARILSRVLGGFQSAGYVHRSAAFLMFVIFLTHLSYLVKLKRSHYGTWKNLILGPDTMLFTKKDLLDFWGSLKWFVGLGERPQYGRWTYWEKFDYFAVFWGIAIIGSTGLLLWFPEFFTRFLPGWFINIATLIHSDEALLAVGFIFTIHFFNTHFRPEKFPMDITIFTGRMPIEELKRDKPAEYEALMASGKLDENCAEPMPPVVIRAVRIFGWVALTIGLSLVTGIIYAILFAYR